MVPDPDTACVGLEYFVFKGDELWTMADDDLVALATPRARAARPGDGRPGPPRLRRARPEGLPDVRRRLRRARRDDPRRGSTRSTGFSRSAATACTATTTPTTRCSVAMRAVDNLLDGDRPRHLGGQRRVRLPRGADRRRQREPVPHGARAAVDARAARRRSRLTMTRRPGARLQALVSLLALGGVVWWFVPPGPAGAAARSPRPPARWPPPSALYLLATLLRGERWHRLVGRGTRADAYALTTVGYMGNNALPARAGDILKAMLTAHRAGGGAPRRVRHAGRRAPARRARARARLRGWSSWPATCRSGCRPRPRSRCSPPAWRWSSALALLLAPRLRGLRRRPAGAQPRAAQRPRRRAAGLSAVLWLTEGAVYAVLGQVAGRAPVAVRRPLRHGAGQHRRAGPRGPRATSAPSTPRSSSACAWSGAGSAAVALPYVVLVRFVLFVPITLVGLVLLLARYGGVAAARAAVRMPEPAEAA